MLSEFKTFINLVYYNLTKSSYLPISMEDFRLLPNHEDVSNSVSLEMVNEQTFSIKEKLSNNFNGSRYMEFQPKMIDNELKDLETRNLKLIENWQVSGKVPQMKCPFRRNLLSNFFKADDSNDTMHRQFTIITKLENRLIDIKTQLEMTQAELERYTERSEELELYCKLFDVGMLLKSLELIVYRIQYAAYCILHELSDKQYILYIAYCKGRIISNKKEQYGLCTEDEILKEFKRKIRRMYNFITDSFTMNIEVKPLSMLTTGISASLYSVMLEKISVIYLFRSYFIIVESRLIDLISIEENLDPGRVRDFQREIERQRKNDLYEQKQKDYEMERLTRNQRANERNMHIVKRGRRLLKRSAKPYQTKTAIVTDNNEDHQDDDDYYFTNAG